jgi:hypothetical protein
MRRQVDQACDFESLAKANDVDVDVKVSASYGIYCGDVR